MFGFRRICYLFPSCIQKLKVLKSILSMLTLFSPHSVAFSAAPCLHTISVSFKSSSSGPTAYLFASSLASHFFSGRLCQWMPAVRKFLFKTRNSVHHFRQFVYKCMTDCSASPHHQHFANSAASIRSRKPPVAQCQTPHW